MTEAICLRHYDSGDGRFIQADPSSGHKRVPASVINKYIYALNNPILLTDSTGTDANGTSVSNGGSSGGTVVLVGGSSGGGGPGGGYDNSGENLILPKTEGIAKSPTWAQHPHPAKM